MSSNTHFTNAIHIHGTRIASRSLRSGILLGPNWCDQTIFYTGTVKFVRLSLMFSLNLMKIDLRGSEQGQIYRNISHHQWISTFQNLVPKMHLFIDLICFSTCITVVCGNTLIYSLSVGISINRLKYTGYAYLTANDLINKFYLKIRIVTNNHL